MKIPCSPLTRNSLSTNIQPKGSFSPGVLSQFGRHFEGKEATYFIFGVILS
jgi:hypothetical protein